MCPDPEVAKFYTWGIHTLLKIPGWDTLFNMGSDFFLYDAARLPLLKYFTPAFLQILNDIANWSMSKKPETPVSIRRRRVNLAIFSLLALFSLFGFVSGGYSAKSSLEFTLTFIFVLIFVAWFAGRMKTKYLDATAPPLFTLFAIPIFMIMILGFSHFLKRVFAHVNLKGTRFRNAPFTLILLVFIAFMQVEGYLTITGKLLIGTLRLLRLQ